MINRLSHWTILTLAVVGLLLPCALTLAEDISEPGDPAGAQPAAQETPTPSPSPAGTEPGSGGEPAAPAGAATTQPTTQPPPPSMFGKLLPLLLGAMVLMWIFAGRKSRKADKNRKSMLADLKKGDKVTSIGGIVGTAMDVREHDVTVKVDETSNTRLKLARWAIRSVGTPAEDADSQDAKK